VLFARGDTLFSSDWHVLHRNIYWFLPEQRQRISGALDPRRLSEPAFLAAERATYERILEDVRARTAIGSVRRFVFLGDLVFGLSRTRRTRALLETVDRELPAVSAIFELLRSRGIERILVLGNHDDHKLRDAAACAFYHRLFDQISLVVRVDDAICTHFPLGYSRAAVVTTGTPDEKYYRMARTFAQLDRRLLDQLAGGRSINLHGHIHAGPFRHGVAGVEYHNVALDIVAGGANTVSSNLVDDVTTLASL
jgi:calcineurin-like phosphoesterase family protein